MHCHKYLAVRERLSSAPTSSNTLKHLIPNACIAKNIVIVVPSINPEDKVSLKYILRQFLKCQKIFSRKFHNLCENILLFAKGGLFEYFRKIKPYSGLSNNKLKGYLWEVNFNIS